ncbi:MAG: DNA topoisomerase III [bacterium]|nr:DNA topoisomerase III [bacterium]
MKVCIAEKPSVAKEIAQILGARSRKDGYFEGNGYWVTWTFGHLCTLKAPDDYTPEWKRWNLGTLPMVPEKFDIKLIKNKGISKQFKTIKSLIDKCSEVINCGDAGIEGELIQRWVLKKASCKKEVKRLWISSLTEEAIREGFNNLKDSSQYDLLYAAGSARAIGDWLLGMNASRLYTLKYAQGKGVLSIGRVQTPTLALIVQRHLEIENFKPETYWEIKTVYRDVLFTASSGRFKKKEDAQNTLEKIKENDFSITSFTRKKGKEQAPQLFDLTSLQVECNKKYSFTADSTLKTVQKLYEKKVVTYPRVDTRFLPDDIYPKVPGILKKLNSYAEEVKPLLNNPIKKSKRIFDDKKITDHHAIIPTGVTPSNLTPQEQKVYDDITRRFIAVFYPDCIVSNTTALGETAGVAFKAAGKQIIDPGWRVLYPGDLKKPEQKKKDDDKKDQVMPEFAIGETGPHSPEIREKETKPPAYYTEASLLRAMETAGKKVDDEELRDLMKENGIGRPSTRANIIETLFKRNYIVRNKKSIVPASTGIQLIETIKNDLLKSVELTGIWEKKLRQIERGEYKAGVFMNEMKEMVSNLVSDVKKESGKQIIIEQQKYRKKKTGASYKKTAAVKKTTPKKAAAVKPKKPSDKNTPPNCPRCGKGTIIKGKGAYGCSEYRNGCGFRVAFSFKGKKFTEKQIFDLIKKKKTNDLSGFMIEGIKTKGKIILDNSLSMVFVPTDEKTETAPPPPPAPVAEKLVCPRCGKGTMIKGKKAHGCSRFREGCNFIIPFDVLLNDYGSAVLTAELLKKISGLG